MKKSKIKRKIISKRIFKIKYIILTIFISFILSGVFLKIAILDQLPKVDSVLTYQPTLSTKFYDRNNNFIFEIGDQKREFIPIKDIPIKLIHAFIAAEDKTFYTNCGIDIDALIKMPIINLLKFTKREKFIGASTITQQVVRNLLLSNERTVTRKIKEIILSVQLTKKIPKSKIMEIYLNHIYLGMQSYGIVIASREYFDKNVKDLTIAEMAMLAALPKAPSAINPFKNKNRSIQRRNWVLKKMFENGFLKEKEYQSFIQEELKTKKNINKNNGFYAPVFFAKNLISESEYKIDDKKLSDNGYNIKLSIDSNLQKIAQNELNKTLVEYSKRHGFEKPIFTFSESSVVEALKNNTLLKLFDEIDTPDEIGSFKVAIVTNVTNQEAFITIKDNEAKLVNSKIKLNNILWARKKLSETSLGAPITKVNDVLQVGYVIPVSIINSEESSLEQIPQINGSVVILSPKNNELLAMVGGYLDIPGGFNRASQAYRQIGSTVKPFVYSAAFENNIKPNSIFIDSPISMNLGNGVFWNPENHTKKYLGAITARTAFEKSINTVTIRIADAIKIGNVIPYLKSFGLNQNPEVNLSTVLGSVESNLLALTNGAAVFANYGIIKNIKIIESISNYKNEITNNNGIFLDSKMQTPVIGSLYSENNKKSKEQESEKTQEENETDLIKSREESNRIIKEQTAFQILSLMEGAAKRGTAHELGKLGINIAAKTGTSNEGKDMWTIAVTPDLVIGVFVGYDQPIQTNSYGSQYALPVVYNIIDQVKTQMNFNIFKTPKNIKYVKINRYNGKRTNLPNEDKKVIYEVFDIEDSLPPLEDDFSESNVLSNVIDLDSLN